MTCHLPGLLLVALLFVSGVPRSTWSETSDPASRRNSKQKLRERSLKRIPVKAPEDHVAVGPALGILTLDAENPPVDGLVKVLAAAAQRLRRCHRQREKPPRWWGRSPARSTPSKKVASSPGGPPRRAERGRATYIRAGAAPSTTAWQRATFSDTLARHSLKCYECTGATANKVCNGDGPTACAATTLDTCGTMLLYPGHLLHRHQGTTNGATLLTTCCQSDGCNVNAAPPRPRWTQLT
uniref:Uncharacterized protein LOC116957309 n=1 Tax=Petromyzon marinus TaxID=7757 RepID=A0AAJ7UGC6_PETMA|nr:uncharacterized protein LOC116957309 [Petromyzon marinus]